jgi:hypothetical protein
MTDEIIPVLISSDCNPIAVEGIEEWITTLLPTYDAPTDEGVDSLLMVDPKTGALFLVRRVE